MNAAPRTREQSLADAKVAYAEKVAEAHRLAEMILLKLDATAANPVKPVHWGNVGDATRVVEDLTSLAVCFGLVEEAAR